MIGFGLERTIKTKSKQSCARVMGGGGGVGGGGVGGVKSSQEPSGP